MTTMTAPRARRFGPTEAGRFLTLKDRSRIPLLVELDPEERAEFLLDLACELPEVDERGDLVLPEHEEEAA